MRLIDADALKAALVPLWNCHDDSDFANKDVWRELENAPTIDAVPVVRCKDCKHMEEHYDTEGNAPYWVCKNWYGGTDEDGYCHEAERKEE